MVKLPYFSGLYKSITELVNYTGKKYYDVARIVGSVSWPESRLELALAGVPTDFPASLYTPDGYSVRYDALFRMSSNGNSNNPNGDSNKTYTIKRIGFDGPIKVAIWRSDGRRILLKKSEAKGERLKDYVSRKLKEEQIIASGGELNTIISMLENPH